MFWFIKPEKINIIAPQSETMMRLSARMLVFALVLILGGSAAEKRNLKIHAPEDELFWARELQGQSMSVPVVCAFSVSSSSQRPSRQASYQVTHVICCFRPQ